MERPVNSEQEDVDRQLHADSSATDCEQQTASVKQTQSHATQDALREKIKDMINVAHVSWHCSLEIGEEVCSENRTSLLYRSLAKSLWNHHIQYSRI